MDVKSLNPDPFPPTDTLPNVSTSKPRGLEFAENYVFSPFHALQPVSFKYDLQDRVPCGMGGARDIFIRDIRGSEWWFLEKGLQFGASDLQVCWNDVAWNVQHFVWPGLPVPWQAQRYGFRTFFGLSFYSYVFTFFPGDIALCLQQFRPRTCRFALCLLGLGFI